MKVYVYAATITDINPRVGATYPLGAVVPDDAHGIGMTVLYVADQAVFVKPLEMGSGTEGRMFLVENWRDFELEPPVQQQFKKKAAPVPEAEASSED
jgi:hypothetical protein